MCSWYGAFVYQLGHGPLKAERRVRFPYALPYLPALRGIQNCDMAASTLLFRDVFIYLRAPEAVKTTGSELYQVACNSFGFPNLSLKVYWLQERGRLPVRRSVKGIKLKLERSLSNILQVLC